MRGRHVRSRGNKGQQVSQQAGDGRGSGRSADQDESQDGERVTVEHEPSVNQHQAEPLPASHRAASHRADGHRAASPQPAVTRNEEHSAGRPAGPAAPGQAVQDMMGGPHPQGDVPDSPGTQVAAATGEQDQDVRIKYVANAVPGQPDGEVDTRS